MKSIFESGEIMGYYAQIDYCYHMIKQLHTDLNKPRAPIEKAIDIVTGYDKQKINESKKTLQELLRTVIDCKKKIEADYSGDQISLDELLGIMS
jgi:hypothetical protein